MAKKRAGEPVLRVVPGPGDLERWRGQVDERLDNIDRTIKEGQSRQEASLARLESTMDRFVTKLEQRQETENKEMDGRVRSLEDFRTSVKAKVALMSGAVGLLSGSVGGYLLQLVIAKIYTP